MVESPLVKHGKGHVIPYSSTILLAHLTFAWLRVAYQSCNTDKTCFKVTSLYLHEKHLVVSAPLRNGA